MLNPNPQIRQPVPGFNIAAARFDFALTTCSQGSSRAQLIGPQAGAKSSRVANTSNLHALPGESDSCDLCANQLLAIEKRRPISYWWGSVYTVS